MTAPDPHTCARPGCTEPIVQGGLCAVHDEWITPLDEWWGAEEEGDDADAM